jgi:hypothetical protein
MHQCARVREDLRSRILWATARDDAVCKVNTWRIHGYRSKATRVKTNSDPVAFGQQNCLIAVADSGAERAAAICSLIGTAKVNDIDREA